jgi:hypothetical protein
LALNVTTGAGDVAVTVTVAVLLIEPPAPEQARVYDLVLVSPETLWLPLTPLVPDQPPEAVQLVASALDHVRVELPPLATVAGLAVKDSEGAAAEIEMLTDCMAVPPEPPHVRVYVFEDCRVPVDSLPDTGLVPAQAPDAVQLLASVAFHVKLDSRPLATLDGLAWNVS